MRALIFPLSPCSGLSLPAPRPRSPAAAQNPWTERQRMLYRFTNAEDLAMWNTFSDSQLGGRSTAELRPSPDQPVRPFFKFTELLISDHFLTIVFYSSYSTGNS
jgi:hypothetical protein